MKLRRSLAVLLVGAGVAVSSLGADTTLDFATRVRFESREQTYTFDRTVSAVTDDSWFLTRVRLAAKTVWSPECTTYVQLQDARELGSDRVSVPFISGSEGDDPLDFRQAYVEWKSPDAIWKLGRQVINLGDERLVGTSEWTNFTRTFDAARVTLPKVGEGLDLFVSSVVQIQPGSKTGWHANHSSSHDLFTGAYSRFALAPALKLEPYLFFRNSRKDLVYSAGVAGTSRPYDIPQRVTTGGLRVLSGPPEKLGGFDYDLELAGQTGEARGRQQVGTAFLYPGPAWLAHRAWAVHAGAGYSPSSAGVPLRLYAEINRGTGDGDPTDRVNEGFLNLFASNHKPYGIMDVFSWKNMREVALSAVTAIHGTKARLEQHWFALDNVNDAWYRSSASSTVRTFNAAARRAPRRAGNETDLLLSRPFGKSFLIEAGYCTFAAGDYLRATGGASDAHLGYVQVTFQR